MSLNLSCKVSSHFEEIEVNKVNGWWRKQPCAEIRPDGGAKFQTSGGAIGLSRRPEEFLHLEIDGGSSVPNSSVLVA